MEGIPAHNDPHQMKNLLNNFKGAEKAGMGRSVGRVVDFYVNNSSTSEYEESQSGIGLVAMASAGTSKYFNKSTSVFSNGGS